jgi:hypothetical protein
VPDARHTTIPRLLFRIAEMDASSEGVTRPQGEARGRAESNPEEGGVLLSTLHALPVRSPNEG